MSKRIRFTDKLTPDQFWCGDDLETPALYPEGGYAELHLRAGDVVEFDRLGNAQQAIDRGYAVIVEDEAPKTKTKAPGPIVQTAGGSGAEPNDA